MVDVIVRTEYDNRWKKLLHKLCETIEGVRDDVPPVIYRDEVRDTANLFFYVGESISVSLKHRLISSIDDVEYTICGNNKLLHGVCMYDGFKEVLENFVNNPSTSTEETEDNHDKGTISTRSLTDEASDLVKDRIPITVDFDGTLCYPHAYPLIIEENKPCFDVLRKWQEMGCMIILNTMRGGQSLKEAIEWCGEKGFEFDAVGRNPTQDEWCEDGVWKCYSMLDIDDRNAGCPMVVDENDRRGHVDWNKIDEEYTPRIKKLIRDLNVGSN